ncbi:MAG: family 20 glycosylhydrolase [Planctomycetota bacterium]|nr:family 20 glycosylhydrolase [Planctomycetota bacterium]
MRAFLPSFVCLVIVLSVGPVACQADQAVSLLPTPKEIKVSGGVLDLPPSARIVAASKELVPLAAVLSDDIRNVTGVALPTAQGEGKPGDVVLRIDPALVGGEAKHWPHTLTVADDVQAVGGDYNAVALATSSIVQLVRAKGQALSMPKLALSDYSAAEYTGVMLDVARQGNTLADVRNLVNLMRLYKARYLHLHLNDQESCVFPSKVQPKLGSSNGSAHGGPKCEQWNRDELLATIKYADERGVTLVPELETVFHSASLQRDMPQVYGTFGVLDMGSDAMYTEGLEPLIREMAEVFKSSPFFHIGCDEAGIGGVLAQPKTKDYMAKHGLKDGNELYVFHINRLDKVIKAAGKRTIVWQDCPLPPDNKDVICMVWRMDWNHGMVPNLVKDGRPSIQVTWTPSCGWPVRELYRWRPYDEQVRPGKLAIGSQLVLWEQNGSVAIPFLRQKMPARQQFTYSPDSPVTYEEFAARLAHADSLLDAMSTGIAVTETGLCQTVPEWLAAGGVGNVPEYTFDKNLTLTFKSHIPGAKVRYTVTQVKQHHPFRFFGTEPKADSPEATGPVTIAPPEGEAVCVQARLFDTAGQPAGAIFNRVYRWQPYVVKVAGTIAPGDNRFGKAVTISLERAPEGGTVRYQVNGPVTDKSQPFTKPVILDKSGSVSVAFLDAQGKPKGLQWQQGFRQVDFDPANITYKKPAIEWGASSKQASETAVDGVVDRDSFLDFSPGPQNFAIDLQKVATLEGVTLYTFWDGRHYQYKIFLSTDAKTWTEVVDASKNTQAATEKGYSHAFAPTKARYIRVTMLRNSANIGLHIVELRAKEAK